MHWTIPIATWARFLLRNLFMETLNTAFVMFRIQWHAYIIFLHRKCHLKTQTLSAVNPISSTHSSTSRSNQETTVDENFAMTQCSAYSTVNPSQPSLANSPPLVATFNNDSTYSNIKEMQMVDPPQEYEPIDQLWQQSVNAQTLVYYVNDGFVSACLLATLAVPLVVIITELNKKLY